MRALPAQGDHRFPWCEATVVGTGQPAPRPLTPILGRRSPGRCGPDSSDSSTQQGASFGSRIVSIANSVAVMRMVPAGYAWAHPSRHEDEADV